MGSLGRTGRRVVRCRRRKREGLGPNRDVVAFTPVSDGCGSGAETDDPGSPFVVEHGLAGLKGTGSSELHLQHLRAGDRVQSKRIHARKFGRTPLRPSMRRLRHVASVAVDPVDRRIRQSPDPRGSEAARPGEDRADERS